ncbi:hypothetical protein B0H14DRAFT_2579333 [Mycena olivaceomarginata]|nr:hypothetical protein B0H14DRAFT_2579333 [Mycena olivaceomarginata]
MPGSRTNSLSSSFIVGIHEHRHGGRKCVAVSAVLYPQNNGRGRKGHGQTVSGSKAGISAARTSSRRKINKANASNTEAVNASEPKRKKKKKFHAYVDDNGNVVDSDGEPA